MCGGPGGRLSAEGLPLHGNGTRMVIQATSQQLGGFAVATFRASANNKQQGRSWEPSSFISGSINLKKRYHLKLMRGLKLMHIDTKGEKESVRVKAPATFSTAGGLQESSRCGQAATSAAV